MTWSYCSHTQRFEQRSGEPRSFSSAAAMLDRRLDRRRRRAGSVAACGERPVVERRLVASSLIGRSALTVAAVPDDEAQVSVVLPIDGEIEAPFAEDRLGLASPAPA